MAPIASAATASPIPRCSEGLPAIAWRAPWQARPGAIPMRRWSSEFACGSRGSRGAIRCSAATVSDGPSARIRMTTRESLSCARCGAGNRLPRRFCGQCGAALPVACTTCTFANEPDARFCGGCGASIGTAAASSALVPSAEAELRPVTVLFADVCGYTRLSQSMLVEDMHALLHAFFDAADEAIERYGGRVDKHIGDAVMGVFGAPVARGDEPARAVRAAHAMIHDVRARTSALGRALDL